MIADIEEIKNADLTLADIEKIKNADLTLADIPPKGATYSDIAKFALTFDGYEEAGSFEDCADIVNAQKTGTLTELRVCLFFEQRRWRHFGYDPDEEKMTCIRKLVDKIRTMVSK